MKTLTTFILFFITLSSFAQLKVTETKKEEVVGEYNLLGTSYAKIAKDGEYCFFTYRDEKFAQIDNYKSFYFKITDLDSLYDLLTNFTNIEKGSKKTVELENGDKLDIEYKKTMGTMFAEVYHISKSGVIGKLRYLTPKQLKKLFGKE
mgnify:CR=1 FL=1